jgi:hypothetical protein
MRPPISDDRLFDLALATFRHPPQSYYDWVDETLERRRRARHSLADHETDWEDETESLE